MKITKFEEILAWQEARTLVNMVYNLTRKKEFSRDYKLAGQIQSAAVSTMSNIAEGFDRRSNKDFLRFLDIAYSSATEVQSQLYVANDQAYVVEQEFAEAFAQADKAKQLIAGFARYLKTAEPIPGNGRKHSTMNTER